MHTKQILCTLRNVRSFLGVFPSDLLPQSVSQSGTVIINADPHTEKGSHLLAVHFRPKSFSAYFFESYLLRTTRSRHSSIRKTQLYSLEL